MEALVILIVFGSTSFIAYLFLSARHKERMAIIENDKDMSILKPAPRTHASWSLKIGLLLVFGGGGILLGNLMSTIIGIDSEITIPSFLFMSAGTGLLIFYSITRKLLKEENDQL